MVSEKGIGERTLRYRWVIFIILLGAYFLVYFQRNLPATLDTTIVDDLGEGIATLWAAAYFFVYAGLQLPVGLMTDRIGPRKVLTVALMVTTLGTFTISLADSFLVLMIGKIIMSCGMACIYVPITKIIVLWFVKRDYAKLNGFVIAAGNLAGIMAAEPARILLDSIGWRGLFVLIGIATITLTILCVAFVRNRPRDIGSREIYEIYPEEMHAHEVYDKVPLRAGIATTVRGGRAFWMPAISYFFVFGTMMLFQGRWMVKYFNSVYDFAVAGTVLLTLLAIGKLISTASASTVARKMGSKRRTMLCANVGYLAMWGLIWAFAGDVNVLWFWAFVSFMFGFCSGFMSLGFAQSREWFASSISGTAVALYNTMVFLGGGILQTVSIFVINEKAPILSQFTAMWGIAFVCVAIACVMTFLSKDNNTGGVIKIRT